MLVWTAAIAVDAAFGGLLQAGLVGLTEIGAVAFMIWRGAKLERDRAAWLLIGSAFALWVIGDWLRIFVYGTDTRSYPSLPDAFYTLFYVVLYAGAGELMRARAPKFRPSLWLDGAIVSATTVAITATVFVGPLSGNTGGTGIADFIYPIGDFVLVVLILIAIVLSGWKPGRQWLVLITGVSVFCLADAWYAIDAAAGAPQDNVWRGTVFALAFILVAFGSALRPIDHEVRFDGLRALAAPMGCAAAAVVLLVIGQLGSIPSAASVLAGAAMLLVIVRCVLTFRENLGLMETREQAVTDELTGLANRRHLLVSLEQTLASEEKAGLLIVDLDRFKELNDTLGHQVGDRLLNAFAGRLAMAASDAALVARLGGDEFALLLTGDVDESVLSATAGGVLAALSVPFAVDGLALHLGASIGGALHPEHANEPFGLMRRADVAMYTAKRGGGGYECYRVEDDEGSRERLEIGQDLRGAAPAGQFVLHYQPKANLPGGHVEGVEALIRWVHPERGMIPPDAFLSIAEETGMMRDLTLWVVDEALRQMAEWDDEGLELTIAINLAMTNLLDVRLPDDVSRLLDGSGTDASRLVLEINENVVMADERRIMVVLEELRSLGLSLSLDDFGAGHTSFAYLKRLPIQELKIDRSFVMEVESNPDDAAIVRASAQLGRDLGLRVVAEGVETPEAMAILDAAGVDIAQGYLLSKPLPAPELAQWVRTRQAAGGGERTLDPHVA